jgi:carbamoyl-phosphate synthase large subunit
MPKRNDIKKVMIVGSGPIIIGQACEFDYSGTQACKALRGLGYETVLVNSNPATIMTDPDIADFTYIEPLTEKSLAGIIEKERPDAILPNLGGQTALNLCLELHKSGTLERFGVKIIGVSADSIERGEDRIAFKKTMDALGVEMPRSEAAYTVGEAEEIAARLGYPVVIRPAYTMGGTGGGLVYNIDELRVTARRGIGASMVGQILVEESVLGWQELELEIIRDQKNQMIAVCGIENIDAVGVHTGDSFCVAPMQSVPASVQKRLEQTARRVVEAVGVVGGTNVQFAYNPADGRIAIIEINPRTSRSSALASKATGLPIAYVSALLATGVTLDEIPYWRGGGLDRYVFEGDYVAVKFARWAFEKFDGAVDRLGTQMKAVGEVMSIGKTFNEAFLKAVRSLETGRYGLGFAADYPQKTLDELFILLAEPSSERYFVIYEALKRGADVKKLHAVTHVGEYFLEQMQRLVRLEERIVEHRGKGELPHELLKSAKAEGFSDRYLAGLLGISERELRGQRVLQGIRQGWGFIRVSGVEDARYYYSSYNLPDTEAESSRQKVMILGGGPNRIGQGIEFDYCCVHAVFALRDMGIESIMVNCNPETVSTDFDTADRLYFEPLTVEDVLGIYEKERPLGVIVQFGGQTPLNIAAELEEAGVRILGTPRETIDLAEDRDRFRLMMERLGIPMPESGMAADAKQALEAAGRIGYPLMVRPSYVLGGRGMQVVYDEASLEQYMAAACVAPERPVLVDRFLGHAVEAEADAIANGADAFVPAVMEHIEYAGVHSGDSACVIPPISLPGRHIDTIENYTRLIAREMGVVGLMNMQYAVADDRVYVLEANPRASRTVPLVSKVCSISMAKIATEVIMGDALSRPCSLERLKKPNIPHFGVKEAVLPFNMFPEVDPVLGPEMRSTGEVLGLAESFGIAFFKAQESTQTPLPCSGVVLISVNDADKAEALGAAKIFAGAGFGIRATAGTCEFLRANGVGCEAIKKLHEGRPNILDAIANGELDLIINTPASKAGEFDDSYIRKAAIRSRIPYITTATAALASAKGILEFSKNGFAGGKKKSLQEYHRDILKANSKV